MTDDALKELLLKSCNFAESTPLNENLKTVRSTLLSEKRCSPKWQWSTAPFGENGRIPRLRYRNDAPGTGGDNQSENSPQPRRLETRTQRGFPHFHSDDCCGSFQR